MRAATEHGVVPEWTFADRLIKARTLAGYSQVEMAERLGVSRASVVNYEQGHTTPTRSRLRLWAERTGVDPGWLETGVPSAGGPPGPGVQNRKYLAPLLALRSGTAQSYTDGIRCAA